VLIGQVSIEKRMTNDGTLHVTIAGKIDERFDASSVVQAAHGKVVMHLGGVRSISSLGVRAFEHFVQALPQEVVLIHVSPAVASQLAMIPNLMPTRARVESAKLPFVCPACGSEKVHSVPFRVRELAAHAPTCSCGAKMELDGLPEQYLPS
jgi:anti-anti-sigma regulatory factor